MKDAVANRYEAECPMCGQNGFWTVTGDQFFIEHVVGPSKIGKYDARFSVYCTIYAFYKFPLTTGAYNGTE